MDRRSQTMPVFAAGVACFGASAVMAVGFCLRYWFPVLFHHDWACYISRMYLLPGETCEAFEQAAVVLSWLSIPFGVAGLALMARFRAGIKPLVQRACFWSVISVFLAGGVMNLGYSLLPRSSPAFPLALTMFSLSVSVVFCVTIIFIFVVFKRPK